MKKMSLFLCVVMLSFYVFQSCSYRENLSVEVTAEVESVTESETEPVIESQTETITESETEVSKETETESTKLVTEKETETSSATVETSTEPTSTTAPETVEVTTQPTTAPPETTTSPPPTTTEKETEKIKETEEKTTEKQDVSETENENNEDGEIVEIVINSIGDCTFGMEYARWNYERSFNDYYDRYGAGYFFKNVADIFKNDDLTIANLEGPLTESNNLLRKEYNYKGLPEYAKVLTEGNIEVVNVENNHTYDYGTDGFNDTITALESENIYYVGNGAVYIQKIKGVKIGIISSMGTDHAQYRLNTLKKQLDFLIDSNVDIKIVIFHWGTMMEQKANIKQQTIAHFMIDNGADLVLGHHPHVLQGIENYKDRYIAYSLGNFIFDWSVTAEERAMSMIFQTKFYVKNRKVVSVDAGIIPVYITSVFDEGRNNFQPLILEGEARERVLQKIYDRSPY